MRASDRGSAIEQGWQLRELGQRFGPRLEEQGRRFDRSTSWVSRRLGLVTDLPASVQEQVRTGATGAHAAMKYSVPLVRANAVDCGALGQAFAAIAAPLGVRLDPKHPERHAFVEPAIMMTVDEYQVALCSTRALWSEVIE